MWGGDMSLINRLLIVMGSAAILFTGCGEADGREQASTAESCMTCHGGNPKGANKLASHIPAPPEIGDREQQTTDPKAWFNRLTLTGIDKFPDYQVGGTTYTSLRYLPLAQRGRQQPLRRLSLLRMHGLPHAIQSQRQKWKP